MTELNGPSRGARWRAISFRRTVHAYLTGRGLRGLSIRDTSKPIRLSESILEERSDIRGLRDFSVLTRVDYNLDFSEALDKAAVMASDDDKIFPVVVQWRKGRDNPGHAYVAMRLSDWASMVELLEERPQLREGQPA